jgi:hypothetical protein
MIKHEEVRKIILFVPKDEIILQQYITEQEKKDKLLGLYRELVEKEEEYNTSDNTLQKMRLVEYLKGTRLEINALEEEMK